MDSDGGSEIGRLGESLLAVARHIAAIPAGSLAGPDCVRLSRKVSLLCHLFEEIGEFGSLRDEDPSSPSSSSSPPPPSVPPISCLVDLLLALEAVRRFLLLGRPVAAASDQVSKNVSVQFQYVTWQLEKALENLPYDYFDISDEVGEQVELVCAQLRRSIEKSGPPSLEVFAKIYHILSHMHDREITQPLTDTVDVPEIGDINHVDSSVKEIVVSVAEVNGKTEFDVEKLTSNLMQQLGNFGLTDASHSNEADTAPNTQEADIAPNTQEADTAPNAHEADTTLNTHEADMKSCDLPQESTEKVKKADPLAIPEDFRCPISLELMRDPVIVATGQTYERASIQRWIDGGNRTCPKTQQKLQNLTLTPNYVLRSLIMQWCEANNFEQPYRTANGLFRKSDGTYLDVSGDRAAIYELVRKLSSGSTDEQRSSAAEIRSMAKRSTDNRILIAEAGAIPILVNLLSVDDEKTQEHAVTAILNLSIYDNNKGLIMLAGAITPIIQVLRSGCMEARENAAAAIFSLSLVDDNKITIGSTPGAIDELVELLQSGSVRGRKDAATALFNLCIYQGNKARAVRAGILSPLLKMLTDPSGNGMVDEALTILSVLVSHQEGKVAITKANLIPILIDLLRNSQPRNKENAAAILLALCKKDHENLACIGRLGALIPLTELAKSGTDRAKRKANSLLDHLNRLHRL